MLDPLHLQSYNDCCSGGGTWDISIMRLKGEANTQESAMFDEFISFATPAHHRTVDKSGNAERQLPESLIEGQI